MRRQLLNYEKYFGLRQRARRPADQARFDRIVSAILCELMHAAMNGEEDWRHISLSKRHNAADGVGAPFMTADRLKIIQWMTAPEMDWLELQKGIHLPGFGGKQSRIRASARLRRRMDEHEIQYEDIGVDPSLLGDPIVLRSTKRKGRAKNLQVPASKLARKFRAEMQRINAWLSAARIACDVDHALQPRDVGDRWLKRIFNNGQLDQGGRLYGGFWQSMSAEDRLSDIRLEDTRIVSLDFGQCGVRIAYGLAGAQPPDGDLYSVPGLAGYRQGVKVVLNAMLARTEGMDRRPAGSGKLLPRDLSIGEVERAILSHHRAIAELCYRGVGLKLQFVESQVLVHALLQLAERGIAALPIHDCLLAPAPTAAEVKEIMLGSFKHITGVDGAVSVHQ